MNHIQPRSKIYLLLIVMVLASGIALVAAQETHASLQSNLKWSVRAEDDLLPVDTRLLGPSGIDGFAQIKATALPVDTRLPGPSGVDGFAQIKATTFPEDTRLPGPSGVDELKQIKVNGGLMP